MSHQQGPSFRANESIGAYLVVAVNASTTTQELRCELADTSSSMPLGIIQDSVSTDGSANIITSGVARGQCSASISAGALLTWATGTGKLVEVANNTTSATNIARTIGIALHAGSTDAVILVHVNPTYIQNKA